MDLRRARPVLALGVAVGLAAACVHAPPAPPTAPALDDALPPSIEAPPLPPQYLVSEQGPSDGVLSLGKSEGVGVLVEGRRVVVVGAHVRVAEEVPKALLKKAWRVPPWLGGGYLFASERELWTSGAFDGPLHALVSLPSNVSDVAFGPRFALVRAEGERFALDPRTGARATLEPRGVVDVAALADGRAVALGELGAVYTSTNGGGSWSDARSPLAPLGAPSAVWATEDALWIEGEHGAARLESGGALSTFADATRPKAKPLRARDPRWHGSEAPIRRALRLGLAVDETTAFVVETGSVVRVHLLTGEIVSYAPGRLPPDATCEAVRASDDVLFACARPGGAGAFVASRVLGDKPVLIEQTFTTQETFVAGDDGSLAFPGPCTRSGSAARAVCVRTAGGTWQEHDLDALAGDAGAGGAPSVRRWIPRPDGSAWGLVTGSAPALVDARTGESHALKLDPTSIASGAARRFRTRRYGRTDDTQVVDRTWTLTAAGTIRGWLEDGSAAEVGVDGSVTLSPFAYEQTQTHGAYAFARGQGKSWQTTDRGASWVEVEPPPSPADVRFCSALGCDLGRWYRVGWQPRTPTPKADATPPTPPPRLAAPVLPRLSCKPSGPLRAEALARTSDSPDDLELGLARLPVTGSGSKTFLRTALPRIPTHPVHESAATDDEDATSHRAVLSGVELDSSSSLVTVPGPGPRDPLLFRRPFAWVPPFDPSGAIRRGGIAIADLVAAGRAAGLHSSDLLAEDPTLATQTVPMAGPELPGDLLLTGATGILATARAGGRIRVAVRPPPQDDTTVVSAAQVGDDVLWLDVDGEGHEWVRRLSAGSVVELFDVPAPPSQADYPIVPDALAVGPHAEVALLRATSGDPPTEGAPMLLYQPGSPPQALAPWSTLSLSDGEPACKGDGFRAVLTTPRPWVDAGADLQKHDGRALLRVKWSATRVCLEAVEIEGTRVHVTAMQRDGDEGRAQAQPLSVQSWLVARLAAPASAARVALGEGIEWRQPLACALAR